jgi:V/A-type H+-transporting ATPase subunit D
MEQGGATRSDLLARKSQMALATQGAGLLKSKREALLKGLMELIHPLVDAYAKLPERTQHAARSLALTEAVDGGGYLRSMGLLAEGRVRVDHEEQSFWGVKVPKLKASYSEGEGVPSAESGAGLSAGSVEAARDFESLVEALLVLAPLQLRLTRLGSEIRSTSRRVNALDQIVIPNIKRDIKTITQALEEIEREDLFRLRRIKKKKEKSR